MNEFKEAHKQYQKSMQDNSQLRELRGDIDIIEMEKENGEPFDYKLNTKLLVDLRFCVALFGFYTWLNNFWLSSFTVKKRIDRTQSRLDKLSNQELVLEAAHALRIERERLKELQTQLEQQMQDIQRATTVYSIIW